MSDIQPPITVSQEHLLKRELVRLQLSKESASLDNMINLDHLGAPFIKSNGEYADAVDYPLTSYILRNFVVSFPLVAKAKLPFWQDTAQPFIQGLASKDISSSADRDEATKRRRMGRVIKRLLLLFYVAGLGSNRDVDPSQNIDLKSAGEGAVFQDAKSTIPETNTNADETIVEIDPAKQESEANLPMSNGLVLTGAYAAVLGVREVSISGYIRNKTHSEYIIECFASQNSRPIYVRRSWSDFVELSKQLQNSFPGKQMPNLPHKSLKNTIIRFNGQDQELLREPQRVTLRHYVHRLCQIPRVVSSNIFLEFLFENPIELEEPDRRDIEARLSLDRQRSLDKKKFRELVHQRELVLSQCIGEIKEKIILEDALPSILIEIKRHNQVEDMSPLLQRFVEWCLVQVALVLHNLFIARDNSPEMFSQVKRLHSLMPYTAMRGILKLSNPALVLKKLTELFMATPFGTKSLIQQMFIRILSDDMLNQEKLIADLELRIPETDLIEAIEMYIAEEHYARVALQERAADSQADIVMEIFNTYLSRERSTEVSLWHKKWQKAVNDPQMSEDEDPMIEKYSLLKDLLKLKVRARDKNVLREFWGDQQTIQFIREIVNLTYDVFIDIFKYAHVSESFGDFQKFMNDIVEYVEYATTEVVLDSSQMVDDLLNVLKKHQNSIFKFINRVYARDSGFFVDLIEWLTLFVSFIQRRKERHNDLDLLGLVAQSKCADPVKVSEELADLATWLQRRKETAKETLAVPSSTSADDFPMSGNFEISDVGLSWDDIDYGFAEVEQDDFEEFVAEPTTDLSKDQITIERRRRERLAEMQERRAQLSPRPEMKETAKLLPEFENMVSNILRSATLQKKSLKDLDLKPADELSSRASSANSESTVATTVKTKEPSAITNASISTEQFVETAAETSKIGSMSLQDQVDSIKQSEKYSNI